MPAPLLLVTSLPAAEEAGWRDALGAAMPDERILTISDGAEASEAEVAIVANPPLGALAGLSNLRWIQSLWAGVDRLVLDDTLPDVPVRRLVDPTLARAMAEAVAAAVLSLHRDFPRYAAQQRTGMWRQHPVRPASARCVTILGLGEMGRAAADLLRAIGFPVRAWSRSGTPHGTLPVACGPEGLARSLAAADILVNLLPLTPDTRGILAADTFRRLPPGAALVNFGRGAHLVEDDLLAALEAGALGHAILDVFPEEPLPPEHRLWAHPGITILPHVAAPTDMASAAAIVADAVAEFRRTGRAPAGLDRMRGY
ncbi:glyoxylate/hydroxypyruvate reductase A [Methylobacterium sp. Leaf104]|uniref:2-hydroxyacid dehydrogenase n=1 Tax=Methylobacterium TaxID=407 RepID=UPI0006FB0E8A|nr:MULTISPECIES: glyoxylate/hydroxypyruvate reductase A [Methylobacterium]KQP30584.1 glyoxylate/hydroxypyruvate reductase A [Methylobacterium sp. Leaf104]MCI9882030.1 glyoxylate/hydroxypyruvate reductase A [Methylobacterium goesingense]